MKKITLLLALFVFTTVNAQWSSDTAVNTLVASSNNTDSKSIGTYDGKTFIAFWKSVPAPVNFELRLQLLDENGEQQFGPDGMLVSNTIPMSTSTVLWRMFIDKTNNVYLGVTGTGSGTPGIVYKIDTTGNMLWGATGLNLGAAYLPTVLPLENGEVAICYWPATGGKTKIQKYTNAGTPIWANPIDVVSTNASSATMPSDMYEMGNHDIVVVFHRRLSFGVASNLFAQRFSNTDGAALWATPTQLADKGTVYNTSYSGTQDGDAIFYSFSATTGTGNHFDSYVQRINGDGTLPWSLNGVDFDTNITNHEKDVKIATTSGSDYVWALSRYSNSSQDMNGEYVQKFNKLTGARQFTDNAKEVFAIDSNSRAHIDEMYLINDAPFFLMKSGFDNGVSPTTLNVVQLNSDGNFVWTEQSFPVATFSANKGRITFNKPYNGGVVAVFSEAKVSGEPKIYAQKFTNATLGINDFEITENNIDLYPNPSNSIFNITSKETILSVNIIDMLGKQVHQNKTINNLETTIDATNWAKGIYLISVETTTTKRNIKFIKS